MLPGARRGVRLGGVYLKLQLNFSELNMNERCASAHFDSQRHSISAQSIVLRAPKPLELHLLERPLRDQWRYKNSEAPDNESAQNFVYFSTNF